MARSEPPLWFSDEQSIISLKADPKVQFDEEHLSWFHSRTGKICAFFSPPLIDQVTHELPLEIHNVLWDPKNNIMRFDNP